MRSPLRLAIVALTVAAVGCKPAAKPCASMTSSVSELLQRAAVVRLDIYGGGAHCDGATLAAGAPPASQSQTVSAGKALTLDVPAGNHVLLLSAFRDTAATQLLGSACTETDVKANQPGCFDLKLVAVPDGSVPITVVDMATQPMDLASTMSGDLAQFIACSASPDNCPAGQYCASNGNCAPGCKVDLDCTGTPATPRCLVAAHECVTCLANGDCPAGKLCSPSNTCVDGCDPKAPDCPSQQMCCSDFCIDTTSDVNDCGSCGKMCSLANATAKCASSACAVKSCTTGFSDCNGTASDGCECADVGDATHGCCTSGANSGKCEGAHSDGLGDAFHDCTPKGTYSLDLANDAAKAYYPTGTAVPGNCTRNDTVESVVCMTKGSDCVCFTYADNGGGSYVGRARKTTSPAACTCAFGPTDSGDITWF